MVKKKSEFVDNEKQEELEVEVEPVVVLNETPKEECKLEVHVAPPPKTEKTVSLPVLPITEVARAYKQYKKSYDESILSFCKATGLPSVGTADEMKVVLKKFGW